MNCSIQREGVAEEKKGWRPICIFIWLTMLAVAEHR